jgi:putative flippase GtrA
VSVKETDRLLQLFRYIINGVVATIVHFGLLALLIEGLVINSAAAANGFAALVGVAVSFMGNRYFVFKSTTVSIYKQAGHFGLLYTSIALVHIGVMFLLSDLWGLSYQVGFLAATIIQFVLSYFGNRFLVFQ